MGAETVAVIVEDFENVILVQGLIEEVKMNNSILITCSLNYLGKWNVKRCLRPASKLYMDRLVEQKYWTLDWRVSSVEAIFWYCYIIGFRSFSIYDFIKKTYTWLEKGSIRPDVSLTAAAETMNKMCLGTRGSAQSFQVRMQEINSH